jgi:hypothetical protein
LANPPGKRNRNDAAAIIGIFLKSLAFRQRRRAGVK